MSANGSADEDQPWTFERLEGIGGDLLGRVSAGSGRFEVKNDRVSDGAHYPYVHGLTQHALRLGRVVIELYGRDLRLEAIPTVRTLYECAITSCWLADSREGSAALFNQGGVDRRRLMSNLKASGNPVFVEGIQSMQPADAERLDSIANEQARNFKERCHALTGGAELYAYYAALCSYGHPSSWLVDSYLQPDERARAKVRLLTEPELDRSDNAFLHLSLTAMMWAARARDTMKDGRPDRNFLRGIARRLDVSPDSLRLTPDAYEAERRADQERRRAARKRPGSRRPPSQG